MTDANAGWEVFDDERPLLGGGYSENGRIRMIAVGLRDGGLCVVSPGAELEQARFAALERWGRPRFLLAPNHFHHFGIHAWKQRYPDAIVVASPRARARLKKKVPGADIQDVALLEPALPPGVRVFGPPMAKQGETWLSVRTKQGVAWFVTDAIMNEPHLPGGPLGLLLHLLGFRTGLHTNPFFKRVFLESKAAYKDWVIQELSREPPDIFIPSHGTVLRGPDVVERLRVATLAA